MIERQLDVAGRIYDFLTRQRDAAESGGLISANPDAAELMDHDPAEFLISQIWKTFLESGSYKNEVVEFRAIWPRDVDRTPGDPEVKTVFESPNKIFSELFRKVAVENRRGYGAYFGINPRPASHKKTEADIKHILTLYQDLDAKNFPGGKPDALKRLDEFPIEPSIIVDSGNGYHAYWLLEEPIIDRTDEDTSAFKQTMSGLARALGGDSILNLDRVFRLPGTLNTKPGVGRCAEIIRAIPDRRYSLGDFDDYRDYKFQEPTSFNVDGEEFQGETAAVSSANFQEARADVERLKLHPRTKHAILTGDTTAARGKDQTKSGRDFRILCALVSAGYGYETARAVFFNRFLPCSDRVIDAGRRADQLLRQDFLKAAGFIKRSRKIATAHALAIQSIKGLQDTSAEEKLRLIRNYIVQALFDNGGGAGYKNTSSKRNYYFDQKEKILFDIESEDFRCLIRDRFDIPEKDMVEVLAGVQTRIWKDGTETEPFTFARFEDTTGVLYISGGDHVVYRLDGETIRAVDNGTDGVIFEFKTDFTPPGVKSQPDGEIILPETVNYFQDGFDWKRCQDESLVSKHLLDKTSFATEVVHNLTPEEQKYLLVLYLYSLFFESILEEKIILCWTGVKASGKGLVSTAVGKILSGPGFLPSHLPDDLRDFQVALCENYYLVLDNVDSIVRSPVTDALCRAATGERISKRKLWTDSEELKIRPRVFLAITSRDPRFKRDDLVDRLIIFNTRKVQNPKSRAALFKDILDARPAIWAELLSNLNPIVQHLRRRKDWAPAGVFRIADWELWARKVHNEKDEDRLTGILRKMNREKMRFGLEDDPLYLGLRDLCYDRQEPIEDMTARQIYEKLSALGDKDFPLIYKTTKSLAKRLNNITEELEGEFQIKSFQRRGRTTVYYISAKSPEES